MNWVSVNFDYDDDDDDDDEPIDKNRKIIQFFACKNLTITRKS